MSSHTGHVLWYWIFVRTTWFFNVRDCAYRIFLCPLTPRFLGTLCTITPGFLVVASMILRYLYSNTPGFPILLAYFLVVCCFLCCLYWFVFAWVYTPWFLGWSYNFLPWIHIIEWVGIRKNMSKDAMSGEADGKLVCFILFHGYIIIAQDRLVVR